MKILMALTYYVPHRTGLTRYVQRLAEALAQRGHQVTILTCRYQPYLAPEETINGVRVVRLHPLLRISRGMVMPTYPFAAWSLSRDHDVVHAHTPLLEVALLAQYAVWGKMKFVITHHGDLVLPQGLRNRFIEAVAFGMYRYAAPRAHAVIAYSDDYAAHSKWLSAFAPKVQTIYPPAHFPVSTRARAEAMKHELGLDGRYVIGYAGRFVEEKRPDLLVRAAQKLRARLPNLTVVFAGEYCIRYDTFFQRCQDLIESEREHLLFLGVICEDERLAEFYAMCDVLALPSHTECFGLVQVEAMLNGTPVVVNGTPGAREAVRVTQMGEVSNAFDSEAFAAALERVMCHRARYVKPREHIRARYDFACTVRAYEALYESNGDV